MRPPAIRYPLPTLLLALIVGCAWWKGEAWTRPARARLLQQWDLLVHGPPVPASESPHSLALIRHRGLLMRDRVAVFDRPGGHPLEPIASRGFVLIYDEWSSKGPTGKAEFYRVGTRGVIGWIAASDLLPWDTRLVMHAEDASGIQAIVPVVAWTTDQIEIVGWKAEAPWSAVMRTERIALSEVPKERLGVLIADIELPVLIGSAVGTETPLAASQTRLRAILGELLSRTNWTKTEIDATYGHLPEWAAFHMANAKSGSQLAEINAQANPERISLGGQTFRFIPINVLP